MIASAAPSRQTRARVSAPSAGEFLFCACQVGAESALKSDAVAREPSLRPAYSRPGLVTFKRGSPRLASDDPEAAPSPLARAWGRGIGRASDAAAAVAMIAGATPSAPPLRLHVFERDRWRPGEAPADALIGGAAALVRAELLALWPEGRPLLLGEAAEPGDHVIDVIVAEGEPLYLGHHRHHPARLAWPGGQAPLLISQPIPPQAPSRAYRKLEEAIAWSRAPVRAGDVALELGSAPGGASYALLRRGLTVHGVDTGVMDPVVLTTRHPSGARFIYHNAPMSQVQRRDLPTALHWVLCDVNRAPQVALRTVARLAAAPRPALMGVLCTLKLDDWRALRHLDGWLRMIEAMGMVEVRATQLPSNRMELFAYGLTEAGVQRRA